MVGYIYITTNLINNKQYIGKRISNEFLGTKYLGSGVLLKKAVNKYGESNFQVKLIEECNSRQQLIEREVYWIQYYNAVNNDMFYNLSYGNEGHAGKGTYKHSEECKRKISIANSNKVRTLKSKRQIAVTLKNKHRFWITDNIKEKLVDASEFEKYKNKGFIKGRKPVSQEQRNKMSIIAINRNKKLTKNQLCNIYGHNKGRKTSDEVKHKISQALKSRNTWSKNRIWVHKDNVKTQIYEYQLDNYLLNGYHRGMYKDKCKICSSTTIENTCIEEKFIQGSE